MPDDITRHYHGGHPRSEEAHEDTSARRSRDQARILKVLHANPRGFTCDEAEVLTGMSHQTCSARFAEMKAKGWLISANEQRLTRSGSKADVWRSSLPAKRA